MKFLEPIDVPFKVVHVWVRVLSKGWIPALSSSVKTLLYFWFKIEATVSIAIFLEGDTPPLSHMLPLTKLNTFFEYLPSLVARCTLLPFGKLNNISVDLRLAESCGGHIGGNVGSN